MLTPGFSGDLCSGYPLHPRLSILESSIGLPYQATDRLCQTIQIPVQYSSRSHSDMGSCINLDGCSSLQSLGSLASQYYSSMLRLGMLPSAVEVDI